MRKVFVSILESLATAGFSYLRWGTLSAEHVGKPMQRIRWFLLATTKPKVMQEIAMLARLPKSKPLTLSPSMLRNALCPKTDSNVLRLKMIGDCVIPAVAQTALAMISTAM